MRQINNCRTLLDAHRILPGSMDPASTLPVAGIETAVQDIQYTLMKLASHAIARKDVANVEELINHNAENEIEREWTDEEIVEQIWLDEIEANGGEMDDEPEEPLIS